MERLAGRVILLWGWQRRLVALAAGAIAALALAPIDFFAGCFIAFPLLVWLIDGAETPGGFSRFFPAFGAGWWFGLGYFLVGFWWAGLGAAALYGLPDWAVPFITFGLAAFMAVFYGMATLLARLLWSDGAGRIAALAFGFAVAEWLRALTLSGNAWNAIGYTAMPVPVLMQASHLVGIFGVGSLAVFVFSAPALLADRPRGRIGLAIAAALVFATFAYGYVRLAAPMEDVRSLQARIVQVAPDLEEGVGARARDILDSYLELADAPLSESGAPRDLILLPERAVPTVLAESPALLKALGGTVGEDQILLLGALRNESLDDDGAAVFYNAVVAVDGNGVIVDATDKMRLLPFVDYVPGSSLVKRTGMGYLLPARNHIAGSARRLLPVAGQLRALPLIGSEIAVPGLIAGGGDLVVNVADYTHYPGTSAPYQHLRQARIRAAESGLPVLVAARGGVSAGIDGFGRITDALAPQGSGIVDVSVEIGDIDLPVFGPAWLRGLIFVSLFGISSLLLSIRGRFN